MGGALTELQVSSIFSLSFPGSFPEGCRLVLWPYVKHSVTFLVKRAVQVKLDLIPESEHCLVLTTAGLGWNKSLHNILSLVKLKLGNLHM